VKRTITPSVATKAAENKTRVACQTARQAGLRYVTEADLANGLRRVNTGRGFRFVTANGRPVRDVKILGRIMSLAIPPAWTDVRISVHEHGHLQATGRDTRQRRQYRYHPQWRAARDQTKYSKLLVLALYLKRIRRRVRRDLALPALPQQKIVAAIVRLLEQSLIRVGNEEYRRQNNSYGLTTLRNRHVTIQRAVVRFSFVGKSQISHSVEVDDAKIAKIVSACRSLPGHELFEFVDEAGKIHKVTSADVNSYLREVTGEEISAKDFRTWAGSVLMLQELYNLPPGSSANAARRNVAHAVELVATRMGNTKSVCRRSYIHPRIIDAYLENRLPPRPASMRRRNTPVDNLSQIERRLVEILQDTKSKNWSGESG
jgi:DNA topoisomerase I